jgi:hypothetical protein
LWMLSSTVDGRAAEQANLILGLLSLLPQAPLPLTKTKYSAMSPTIFFTDSYVL